MVLENDLERLCLSPVPGTSLGFSLFPPQGSLARVSLQLTSLLTLLPLCLIQLSQVISASEAGTIHPFHSSGTLPKIAST